MLILLFGSPSSINNKRKDTFVGKNNNKKERKNNKQRGTKNPNIKKGNKTMVFLNFEKGSVLQLSSQNM
jgi:hypothetical protein